jgi:hypothetical protein
MAPKVSDHLLSLDPPMRFVVSVDEYFGIGLVRDRLISPMT